MVSLAIRDQASVIFSFTRTSGRLTSPGGFGMGRKVSGSRFCWRSPFYISENYSMYGVEILLTRSISPFLLSVYLPSGLLVIISWVRTYRFCVLDILYTCQASFFLPPDLARIGILLCTIILLFNMLNNTRQGFLNTCSNVTIFRFKILCSNL